MSRHANSGKGKVFYVYALLDGRKPGKHRYGRWVFDYEPFYVGKGHNYRVLTHLSMSEKSEITKGSTFKAKLSSKILKEGFEIGYRLIKMGLTEKEAFNRETELIVRIGRRNLGLGPLTNLTYGGEGETGREVSASTRKLLRSIVQEQNARMTEAERKAKSKKLSDAHYARTKRAEKERCSKISNHWNSLSVREKKRINDKKIQTRMSKGWVPKPVLTEEQRKENQRLAVEQRRATWAAKPEHEKEAIIQKRLASLHKTWATKDRSAHGKKISLTYCSQTEAWKRKHAKNAATARYSIPIDR